MTSDLEAIFENLGGTQYLVTSPQTRLYNCIAFAAGETHRWWWPLFAYWPDNAPREETLESFILAFGTLGYSICDDGKLDGGFEKVAIYVSPDGTPTHMARQLSSGVWISKCGTLEDIQHETLEALEGKGYGRVVQFLKRPHIII